MAAEVDERLREFLQTLQHAQVAIQAELTYYTRAPYLDALSLRRLQNSAAELAGQADHLVGMLRERGVDGSLVETATELGCAFRDVADQSRSLRRAARTKTNEERAK